MHFQFKLTLITAFLATAAECAPVSQNPDSNEAIGLVKRANLCGHSTFEGQTTSASPAITHCKRLSSNIRKGGSWSVGSSQRQLASYGSCAFGATLKGPGSGCRVGNEDIMDIIKWSIDRFAWEGLVGSKGIMRCGNCVIDWGLY
ncbi:hypothetical protein ACHAPT_009338 [Fusarium lateritium]